MLVEQQEAVTLARIVETTKKYWGFDRLRPLQEEAIQAGCARRDSLVVMPTGGGKSLCYQAPPVLTGRTDIVVSPLISLMKDQVDALRACGYPAAALHSGLSTQERNEVEAGVFAKRFSLLFVAPERLLSPWFMSAVARLNVQAFAIDEAHCISHWGHDFRAEYRKLAMLKERFPQAGVHAFTATATPRVRNDIVEQLRLNNPHVLVGCFDRPNLVYRVVPRANREKQVLDILRRHKGDAVIVYCISRADTEGMAEYLRGRGVKAEAYHAGLDADVRRRTQDAFAREEIDVVVATVAFGMGIDRSNVRCVIHAAMPKSVEHYQQETGRAGRDGLEAECVLLYSHADVVKWESLIEKSAAEAQRPAEVVEAMTKLLDHMRMYSGSTQCRHRALSEYFGQQYDKSDCGACDVCLNELEGLIDGTVTAQKILSCVARVDERFGAKHVCDVLLGADTENIRGFGHEELSTYGLLKDADAKELMNMVHQLLDQGLLTRTPGDRPILKLNDLSWDVMRGVRAVRFLRVEREPAKAKSAVASWAGVDQGLFEHLRGVRRDLAKQRGVPAFIIFDDRTLRELARVRPTSVQAMRNLVGVGRQKLSDFGHKMTSEIATYCGRFNLETDIGLAETPDDDVRPKLLSAARQKAFALFERGTPVTDVAKVTERAISTTCQYLVEFIHHRKPASIAAWVSSEDYQAVLTAAAGVEVDRLKPIYEKLDGRVSYETVRLVVAHLKAIHAETV